ncbi:hypothetical protein PRIPAC_95247 [Pristionchus pacificus]|uniref:Uncharacterized protein n=1 Tax=Pristionchus pacificus TaxID=54126 RepID=A0A454XJS7_PRIPA|nr:hypothetical protein PRIPAC_95247 [Pristionchus pacificus]|eukprot:PDM81932.1 hypothetical protein PRIPAC_34086 [Pristionchus pacificus]
MCIIQLLLNIICYKYCLSDDDLTEEYMSPVSPSSSKGHVVSDVELGHNYARTEEPKKSGDSDSITEMMCGRCELECKEPMPNPWSPGCYTECCGVCSAHYKFDNRKEYGTEFLELMMRLNRFYN